ncbi:MAG: hypothetical protein AB7N29_17690 [Vicinamibacterales bacterium]
MTAPIPSRPSDTSAEAERVQVELLRAAPVSRRLELAWSLSATVIGSARRALARQNPGLSPPDLDARFVELHYGRELAVNLTRDLARRQSASPVGS